MTVRAHPATSGDAFGALTTAVAAAAVHLGNHAGRARQAALAAGLEGPACEDAAWILLLARGTPAWEAFVGRPGDPTLVVTEARAGDPGRIPLLEAHAPEIAAHYHAIRERAYGPTSLTATQAQLLFCAVGTAIREPGHVMIHARLAVGSGASRADVVRACAAALPVVGYGAWLEAARGLELAFAEVDAS